MKKSLLSAEMLASFCLELSLVLQAGLPAGEALRVLAGEEKNEKTVAWLQGMAESLEDGHPLTETFEQAGGFPPYLLRMVRVGERAGRLEGTFRTLSAYYDAQDRLTRRVRSMVLFPVVLLVLLLAVSIVLLVKVLPIFAQVYAQLGTTLTGVTAGLLHLGEGIGAVLPLVAAVLVVLLALVLLAVYYPPVQTRLLAAYQRRRGDVGLSRLRADAHFAGALATGLSAGLPMEEAAALAADTAQDNPKAAAHYTACANDLDEGKPLADALRDHAIFAPRFRRLIAVGVRSGYGDTAMEQAAARMQADAEEAVEQTAGRIEPAMVIAVSVVFGVILLAVMLPLLNILSLIG